MTSPAEQLESLRKRIYTLNAGDYEGVAMEVWKYQFDANPIYRAYCGLLHKHPGNVRALVEVPFLPIGMFRDHDIVSGLWRPETIFRSSGTTGQSASRHFVYHLPWYHQVAEKTFRLIYEEVGNYCWIALLPGYLERPDSSLVSMVHHFMSISQHQDNGFYPAISNALIDTLVRLKEQRVRTIMIGVSYALLDLFVQHEVPVWDELIVMETGGMKGKRREMTRDELHATLKLNHTELHVNSEYGMTELTSQAYRLEDHFIPGYLMRVMIRDISDPLTSLIPGQRGAINIVDLGNLDTCAFVATEDVGICYPNGEFDVLGRTDDSEARGCNLMYT